MRTRFVVEAHELHDEIAEVVLAEDEDVIEQLTSERADEPFGERVHVGRTRRRPQDAGADAFEGGRERAAEFSVAIADEDLWALIHGRVAGLLRAPRIRRSVGHRGVNDLSPPEVQEEESEDLSEPDVVGLGEIAGPDHVVSEERGPALSVARRLRRGHVPLHSALADADPELEELTANALGAPSRVLCRHLSNQSRTRGRAAAQPPRSASPLPAKSEAMPAEDSGRLHEHRHRSPRGREACCQGHRVSLPGLPPRASHELPLGYDQLLSQQRVLRDQR